MSAWNYYDLAEDQLKAFTRSAVRTKIMLCLRDRRITAGELEKEMNIRTSTILHSMKDLIETGLVNKKGMHYSLTNIGKIQTILLDELVAAIVLLDQHAEYWQSHDLSGIPEHLLAKMGMLGRSQRITSDPASPLKSLDNFMQELSRAKNIRGVSSFIAPGFPEIIKDCVERGANVELILTDSILNVVSKEYFDLINSLRGANNFRLYHLDKNINIGFTVTEHLLALGLWRLDGTIDLAGGELICIGEDATSWGYELFEYYKDISKLV